MKTLRDYFLYLLTFCFLSQALFAMDKPPAVMQYDLEQSKLFWEYAKTKNLAAMRELIKANIQINTNIALEHDSNIAYTALDFAQSYGDHEMKAFLVEIGVGLSFVNDPGIYDDQKTIFFWNVAKKSNSSQLRELLDNLNNNKIYINFIYDGHTALDFAIKENKKEMALGLLSHGANLCAYTFEELKSAFPELECVEVNIPAAPPKKLLESTFSEPEITPAKNIKLEENKAATTKDNRPVVGRFIAQEADLLWHLCEQGLLVSVKKLYEENPNVGTIQKLFGDSYVMTPLDWAVKRKDKKMASFLCDKNAWCFKYHEYYASVNADTFNKCFPDLKQKYDGCYSYHYWTAAQKKCYVSTEMWNAGNGRINTNLIRKDSSSGDIYTALDLAVLYKIKQMAEDIIAHSQKNSEPAMLCTLSFEEFTKTFPNLSVTELSYIPKAPAGLLGNMWFEQSELALNAKKAELSIVEKDSIETKKNVRKSNTALKSTGGELTKSRNDVASKEDELEKIMHDLKNTQNNLKKSKVEVQNRKSALNKASTEILYLSNKLDAVEQKRDLFLCGICKDNVKSVIYFPCHHMAYCVECDDKIEKNNKERDLGEKKCGLCNMIVTGQMIANIN